MKTNITIQTGTPSKYDGKATNTYTTPSRGGQNLHHQITLENHRKAERSEFEFLRMKTNITIQTGTPSKYDGKATNTYTTPSRGGQNLHHQITLENHRKAERSEFEFLRMKTNITIQTGTPSKYDGKATNTYTTPSRGGQNLHHQITLENHRNAERSEFDFLRMKTNISNQTGTSSKYDGKAITTSIRSRSLRNNTAKRKTL